MNNDSQFIHSRLHDLQFYGFSLAAVGLVTIGHVIKKYSLVTHSTNKAEGELEITVKESLGHKKTIN